MSTEHVGQIRIRKIELHNSKITLALLGYACRMLSFSMDEI